MLGHGEKNNGEQHVPVGPRRFAYLPIPSLEPRGKGRTRVVGDARRILLTSFADGCEEEIDWARRALAGMDLIDERGGQPQAMLSLIRSTDNVLRNYTQGAAEWATVTPVILPGYDGHALRKVEKLIRAAIIQAGFSEALAHFAELEWGKVGFWPGAGRPVGKQDRPAPREADVTLTESAQ